MTQLILDTNGYNIVLPESQKGGYTAERRTLYADFEMITGRIARELGGSVWEISYQYGYFSGAERLRLIAACEKGRREAITCGFLAPDSDGLLLYSDFLVTDFRRPKFMWSRQAKTESAGILAPVPVWADFSLALREVKPSD